MTVIITHPLYNYFKCIPLYVYREHTQVRWLANSVWVTQETLQKLVKQIVNSAYVCREGRGLEEEQRERCGKTTSRCLTDVICKRVMKLLMIFRLFCDFSVSFSYNFCYSLFLYIKFLKESHIHSLTSSVLLAVTPVTRSTGAHCPWAYQNVANAGKSFLSSPQPHSQKPLQATQALTEP